MFKLFLEKKTLTSKTFYVGLLTVAAGLYHFTQRDYNTGVTLILGGLAMITGRDAIAKVQ